MFSHPSFTEAFPAFLIIVLERRLFSHPSKNKVSNKIAVDKIILYGSYATGRPKEHSDIDIAVI